MNQKNRIRISILVSLLVVTAVFASFGYSLLSAGTARVILPELHGDDSAHPDPSASADPVQQLEVTPETVQAVIASLRRTQSYYRQLTVQTFWEGGSSTTAVQTWADGDCTYARSTLPSGQVRHTLSQGDTVYYWYSGSSAWFTAPAGSLSPDLAQRLPTYEDVLALDPADISDAGFQSYGDHPCIYAETTVDDLGYLERYWISTDTGLLVASETLKDGQTVYSLSGVAPIQTPCPTDVVFSLPDGRVLHSF